MVGAKIKKFLDDRGIKYKYVSEKTGISPNKLSMILNEKRQLLAEEYFCICRAIDVPEGTFLSKEDPQKTA